MLVREALLADVPQLAHIQRERDAETHPERSPTQVDQLIRYLETFVGQSNLAQTFDPNKWRPETPLFCLVAEEEGSLRGYTEFYVEPWMGGPQFGFAKTPPDRFWAYIRDIYVGKSCRRRGIGRSLLLGIESHLSTIGVQVVSEASDITSQDVQGHEVRRMVGQMMYYAQILGHRSRISGPLWSDTPEAKRTWDDLSAIMQAPTRDIGERLRQGLIHVSEGRMQQDEMGSCTRLLLARQPVLRIERQGIRVRAIGGHCRPGVLGFYERCGFRSIFQSKDEDKQHLILKILG